MIDEAGTETDQFEDFLQSIETEAAPVLQRCGASPQSISDDDKVSLAYFLALLVSRSPRCINFASDVASKIVMKVIDSTTESDRRAVEEATGIAFPAHVDWNKFTLTVSKHTILAGSLEFAQVVARKLLDLTWTFLVTTDDCPFITTDWPALITSRDEHQIRCATLPISSKVAVLVRHGGIDGLIQAPAPDVEKINLRSLFRARAFVLCRKDSFLGDQHLASWAATGSNDSAAC